MKVGLDLTCITTIPEEGKDQVIYNLMRGLRELDHGRETVVFAYSFLEGRVRGMLPDAKLCLFRRFRRGKKLLQDLPLRTFVLPRRVAEHRLDVLCFPKAYTGLRRLSIPTVVIPHDIQFKAFPERYSRSLLARERVLYGLDFQLRDRVVAVSEFDAAEMRRFYPRSSAKVVRIYNPICFSEDAPDGEISPQPRPYLLSINFRYPHKNTITLLRAFDIIRDQIPHDLLLVGKVHPWNRYLLDFVEQRRLGSRVQFTGYVEEDRLHSLIRHAAVYVNPSLYEGFGMTPIEAMGAGTPVVSSRETALFETTRGLAEYYGPALDPAALASKVLAVLAQPTDTAARARIRREIRAHYDYRVIAEEYWQTFCRLAGQRARAAEL
jgi:glycosyltransferase involved in cell wall biosynthesis